MILNRENLGPAERIIQTVLAYSDHMVHNRPGMVTPAANAVTGVAWQPVTYRDEDGKRVVYRLERRGKKTVRMRVGELTGNMIVLDGGAGVAQYRPAGLFPEVAAWLYRQVAEIYALDNELAARWASYAFGEEHRDLKVVLAAFMLVQSRKGDAIRDGDEVVFHDEDYRDVGEAMVLLRRKDGRDLNPKLLLRVHDLLVLPEVARENRELGFGRSARKPFLGRWPKAVEKWLRHREDNLPMLEALVKAGFKRTVKELARRVGYKPSTPRFFEVLGWSQAQAADGRRSIAIGQTFAPAESWAGQSELQICERIVRERPGFKRLVGLIPRDVGITRAVMAAAIESGCLSNKDLIIAMPTLEALGILADPAVSARVDAAVRAAEDQRAMNIALRVKSDAARDKLAEAADNAVKAAVAEAVRGLRVYFFVDISASMTNAIEQAKLHLEKFMQGFPLERLHAAVFNTAGREVVIKHASAAGVRQAFQGISAGGGTDYGAGVRALSAHAPGADEDALFVFVGDEEAPSFADAVTRSGIAPMAFGLVRLRDSGFRAVQDTAVRLGIPCFMIDERTFADPYAIPRAVRALVAATPTCSRWGVGQANAARVTLVDRIIETKLLEKPVWAIPAA